MLSEVSVQGLAESFMLGEVACPDLVAFFQVSSSEPHQEIWGCR